MIEKLKDILKFPFTPIICSVLLAIADNYVLRASSPNTLEILIALVLTAAIVISTLLNIAIYGKAMKIICLVLCLVSVVTVYKNYIKSDVRQTNYENHSTQSYQGSVTFGSSGNSGSSSSSNSRDNVYRNTCTACNGSKKCHVCNGKGYFYCNGLHCLRGKCTACNGTGRYNHGSYISSCLTCSGDGICNICNGSGQYDCSICHGSGKCTHCQ